MPPKRLCCALRGNTVNLVFRDRNPGMLEMVIGNGTAGKGWRPSVFVWRPACSPAVAPVMEWAAWLVSRRLQPFWCELSGRSQENSPRGVNAGRHAGGAPLHHHHASGDPGYLSLHIYTKVKKLYGLRGFRRFFDGYDWTRRLNAAAALDYPYARPRSRVSACENFCIRRN